MVLLGLALPPSLAAQPLSELEPTRELFAIPPGDFAFTREPADTVLGTACWRISFPSSFVSPLERNNTVYGFLYPSPLKTGRAVILLPIWKGSDLTLESTLAQALATYGYHVFVMPAAYQFDRAQPGVRSGAWTISDDLDRTRHALIQTVQDARRAASWLREHEGCDRIAIGGVSLGGIIAALAYGVEPSFEAGLFLLSGGDLGGLLYTSRETRQLREAALARGIALDDARRVLRAVEPVTYADPRRGSGVFLFSGEHDDSIPADHARMLAAAYGAHVSWFPAGHYNCLPWLPRMIRLSVEHLRRTLGERQPR
jgi:dienelactone hydrolase